MPGKLVKHTSKNECEAISGENIPSTGIASRLQVLSPVGIKGNERESWLTGHTQIFMPIHSLSLPSSLWVTIISISLAPCYQLVCSAILSTHKGPSLLKPWAKISLFFSIKLWIQVIYSSNEKVINTKFYCLYTSIKLEKFFPV